MANLKLKFLLLLIMAICCKISNAQTWLTLSSGTSNTLRAIHMVNQNTGYVVCHDGIIRKTINGGISWQSMTSNYPGYIFWDVQLTIVDTGFVCGASDPLVMANGARIMLNTTNGGITWKAVYNTPAYPLRDLFLIKKDTIFAAGGAEQTTGYVVKSVNGGGTWSQVGLGFQDAMFGGLVFINSNIGFLGVYESVFGLFNPTSTTWLNTTNGGMSFVSMVVPKGYSYWEFTRNFPTPSMGYMTRSGSAGGKGNARSLRKTPNGGPTWTENEIQFPSA